MNVKFAALLLAGVLICGLTALPANVDAGTEQNPEIVDDEGDASTQTGTGEAYFDIVAGWFDSDGKNLITNLKIADLTSIGVQSNLMAGGDGSGYYVFFTAKEKIWYMAMSVDVTGAISYKYGYDTEGALGLQDVGSCEGTYTNTAPGIITVKAPLSTFSIKKGQSITDTKATTTLDLSIPGVGGLLSYVDQTEGGKDYSLGGAPQTTNPSVTLSFEGAVEVEIGKSATFEVVATNTQNVSASLTLSANVTGNWTINPASTQITVPANGNQTISYTIAAPPTAAAGDTATITISGAKSPLVVSVTTKNAPGNGDEEKTPGFELLGLIGAIGVAAVLLRRKN